MRILTWNVNGIRTIPQYHPWNSLKTHDDILNYLQADIINFQEVKASRSMLTKPIAVPPSYDSFFSFPTVKTGYSGVATYTRSSAVVPLKAEEGLSFANRSSSQLKPAPALDPSERVSKEEAYPDSRVIVVSSEEVVEEQGGTGNGDVLILRNDPKSLDAEGRVLTLDFGMFVLINVYCPNDGSEERLPFKMDFHHILEARIRGLIAEGREVILVGDLNACAGLIDHCEGDIIIKRGFTEGYQNGEEWFWKEKDGRRWLRDLLVTESEEGRGCFVDITRKYHPERKGMYTCWNTKISARDSNYGTRIDYILITPNLVPWIKDADIQPHMKGSDHCPVYIDLYDEIIGKDGDTLELKDFLSGAGDMKNEPPRLAARFWDEYSGKQKLLSSFFGGKNGVSLPTTPVIHGVDQSAVDLLDNSPPPPSSPSVSTTPAATEVSLKKRPLSSEAASTSLSTLTKKQERPSQTGKRSASSTTSTNKPTKKLKPGQSKLSTFFAQPSSGNKKKAKGKEKHENSTDSNTSHAGKPDTLQSSSNELPPSTNLNCGDNEIDMQLELDHADSDVDFRLALELSLSQTSSICSQKQKDAGDAWKSLMAPIQPPLCTVHNEPAKEFTVNKPGVNKGKKFFVCSRPVGPGYDKGRVERLREDVDPRYKCNFFKWSSDIRREMRKGG